MWRLVTRVHTPSKEHTCTSYYNKINVFIIILISLRKEIENGLSLKNGKKFIPPKKKWTKIFFGQGKVSTYITVLMHNHTTTTTLKSCVYYMEVYV